MLNLVLLAFRSTNNGSYISFSTYILNSTATLIASQADYPVASAVKYSAQLLPSVDGVKESIKSDSKEAKKFPPELLDVFNVILLRFL